MFYPLQSACQWLVEEAKKKVRQDADEAAWANRDSWSEAVDSLEVLMVFIPRLCKMLLSRSCWLQIRLHVFFNIFYDWLPACLLSSCIFHQKSILVATVATLIYAPKGSSQTLPCAVYRGLEGEPDSATGWQRKGISNFSNAEEDGRRTSADIGTGFRINDLYMIHCDLLIYPDSCHFFKEPKRWEDG